MPQKEWQRVEVPHVELVVERFRADNSNEVRSEHDVYDMGSAEVGVGVVHNGRLRRRLDFTRRRLAAGGALYRVANDVENAFLLSETSVRTHTHIGAHER